MTANQFQAVLAVRARRRDLLTVSSIFILGAIWSFFFLWAFALTESWLMQWQAQADSPRLGVWWAGVQEILSSELGIYAPAAVLLLISVMLFFYRVPRVQDRLTVPLEFAITTGCFLVLNVLVMQLLHSLTTPVNAAIANHYQVDSLTGLDFVVTCLMLGALFWLQASGWLRVSWRQMRRTVRRHARNFRKA